MNADKELTRIADALERIADAMERRDEPKRTRPLLITATAANAYLEAMRANAHALRGRMTTKEIAAAIGMELTRGSQAELGRALTEYGARKGKSGSTRYYVFDPLTQDEDNEGQQIQPQGQRDEPDTVPEWMRTLMQENAAKLRGTMALGAVADALGIPRKDTALERLQAHLAALSVKSSDGAYTFA